MAVLWEVAVDIVAAEDEARFHDLIADTPLPRRGAGDGRDGALCRAPWRPMAGACDVLGAGAEMWSA